MNYNLGTAQGNIDINTNGLQQAEVGLRQTGFALTAVGGAMVGAVGYVIKTAADFENSMSAISAITGETGANLDRLREKALELGKEGPYGPKQVADAFIELGKAGLTTQEILDGVGKATITLAAAGDLELARAGEILSNTMRTFQLEAKDAAHIADVLAGAANASTIDVEDLAVSLKYAGSVAAAVGISFEDVSNALVVLGNSGIKGSTGGTSLRRILLNLQPASKAAATQMEELGIITEDGSNKFFTAEGKAKSLGEVLEILKDSTAGLTDAQKLQAINTIFGARASASALILMREGAEGLAEANEMVTRTTADEVATKRLDNLTGSITKLKAALEAVFIEAGTPFQGFLKGIVDGIRQVVLFFGNLPSGVQTAILVIIGLVGAFTLLTGTAFLVLAPMLQLIRLMAVLPESLALVRGTFQSLTAAARGFSLALAVNPVFLIIAAIAALVAALVFLYFKWQPFRDFIDGLWQGIQRVWDSVLDFFEGLPEKIGAAFDKVKNFLSPIFDWMKENWVDVMLALVVPPIGIPKLIVDNWDKITEGVGGAKKSVEEFVAVTGPAAKEAVTNFTTAVDQGFEGMGASAATGGAQVVQEVNQTGTQLVVEGVSMVQRFQDAWTIGWDLIPWTAGHQIGLAIGNFIQGMGVMIDIGSIKAQELLVSIMNWIAQLPANIASVLNLAWNVVVNNGALIVSSAANWAWQTYQSVVGGLLGLPNAIFTIMMGTLAAVVNTVGPAISAAFSWGVGVSNGILNTLYAMPDLVSGILWDVISTIGSLAARAAQAAFDFADGIWQGIKDGLGIHSPSYVEEAFWKMEANVGQSVGNLVTNANQLRALRGLQGTLQVSAMPSLSNARLPESSVAADTGTPGIVVQGPLVSMPDAVIRSDEDVLSVSRSLATLISTEQRAQGRKVLK